MQAKKEKIEKKMENITAINREKTGKREKRQGGVCLCVVYDDAQITILPSAYVGASAGVAQEERSKANTGAFFFFLLFEHSPPSSCGAWLTFYS